MDMGERTVIVTGGASGIGKATAFLLAREGARVLIGDCDEAGGRAATAEGAAERLSIDYLTLDLTSKPSIDDFVAAVRQRSRARTAWSTAPVGIRSSPFSKTPRKCGTASSQLT
jgi:NAD(P)-dependent dehydrogenase (short-subunit alcohol dehydrogenase family)